MQKNHFKIFKVKFHKMFIVQVNFKIAFNIESLFKSTNTKRNYKIYTRADGNPHYC